MQVGVVATADPIGLVGEGGYLDMVSRVKADQEEAFYWSWIKRAGGEGAYRNVY